MGGLSYDGLYRLLLESDIDEVGGNEIWISTFDTYEDLINFNQSGEYSDINIATGWSVGGLAWEWEQKHNVPEPATIVLISLGLAGIGYSRRRKLGI